MQSPSETQIKRFQVVVVDDPGRADTEVTHYDSFASKASAVRCADRMRAMYRGFGQDTAVIDRQRDAVVLDCDR